MRLLLVTSDKTDWALPGFFHQLKKYWPDHPPVVVAGFRKPALPERAEYFEIGNFEDYPVNKWSDSVRVVLSQMREEAFIWTMDDFWLTRPVDNQAVLYASLYMLEHPELARFDLTRDRQFAANMREVEKYGRITIITNDYPVSYLLSFQMGLWRTSALLAYLQNGETPWQTELEGTTRMQKAAANVVGTREEPIRYCIVVQKGEITTDGGYQGTDHALSPDDVAELWSLGYLNGLGQ